MLADELFKVTVNALFVNRVVEHFRSLAVSPNDGVSGEISDEAFEHIEFEGLSYAAFLMLTQVLHSAPERMIQLFGTPMLDKDSAEALGAAFLRSLALRFTKGGHTMFSAPFKPPAKAPWLESLAHEAIVRRQGEYLRSGQPLDDYMLLVAEQLDPTVKRREAACRAGVGSAVALLAFSSQALDATVNDILANGA